jgi:hypothetical protein
VPIATMKLLDLGFAIGFSILLVGFYIVLVSLFAYLIWLQFRKHSDR